MSYNAPSHRRLLSVTVVLGLLCPWSSYAFELVRTVPVNQLVAMKKTSSPTPGPTRVKGTRKYYQLLTGQGFQVRHPERAWGTYLTVTRLQDVMTAHHRRFPDASPVWIHDISARFGGRLEPHVSHRRGQDVDIRVLLTIKTERYLQATTQTIHLERNWHLISSLINTGDVECIFLDYDLQRVLYTFARSKGVSAETLEKIFQYPRSPDGAAGKVRHEPGHKDHLHIRFRGGYRPSRPLAAERPAI